MTAGAFDGSSDDAMVVSSSIGFYLFVGSIIAFVSGWRGETTELQKKQKLRIVHSAPVAYNVNRINMILLYLVVLLRLVAALATTMSIYIMFKGADKNFTLFMYVYMALLATAECVLNYCIGLALNLHKQYITLGSCISTFPSIIFKTYITSAVIGGIAISLSTFNPLTGVLFLVIAAFPIIFYWFFSVKPYYDIAKKEQQKPALVAANGQPNDSATAPPPSTNSDEMRLAKIEAELKKISVTKVKQWYADGKLSEEQYKSIARKYNALKKERADILERMELLRNI